MITGINRRIVYLCLIFILNWACTGNKTKFSAPGPKVSATDPFRNNIIPSQAFDLKTNSAEVLEGNEGIRLVTQPGCFVDKNGKEITGDVKLELAEGFKLEDMVFSNLTTTADGKPLQSGGMFYINASSNGEPVFINPAKPLYVEVPTEKKVPGMQLYTGVRDDNGNMNWINPQPMHTHLVPVDLTLLNFLPEGFEMAVHSGLPFRNHEEATQELVDSLYYCLSAIRSAPASAQSIDYLSLLNDINYESSYRSEHAHSELADTATNVASAGIDPAGIKVLKDRKYQGTYIATREFEKRLQTIFKTCSNELISIYIKYLDKNLWEADSAAAVFLGKENEWYDTFYSYAEEKLTNVKETPDFVKTLAAYYERKLKSAKLELMKNLQKEQKEQAKAERKIRKALTEYSKILDQRETYRMETYGFTLTETGWINIDIGTGEKPWATQELNVIVQNTQTFDQIYTYVFYESIKSLYRLNSNDNKEFFVGSQSEREMPVMKNDPLTFISVAYSGEEIFYTISRFDIPPKQDVPVTLQKGNKATFKKILKQYDKQGKENSISLDLLYMQQFAEEKVRQNGRKHEAEFMQRLYRVAFACCDKTDGEKLFYTNCASCHDVNHEVVGPALAGVTKKYPIQWLLAFTRNSETLLKNRDKDAMLVAQKYNYSVQPSFMHLSDAQMISIYNYIESKVGVSYEDN